MTDFSDVSYTRCPWCRQRFIREEGPLCDCGQDHCRHEFAWENEYLSKIVTNKKADYSPGEFIKIPVMCSKCYKEAVEIYEFKEISEE